MRRILLALLLALYAAPAMAQTGQSGRSNAWSTQAIWNWSHNTYPTISGGAANRCALFGGTTSITSDSGCTYSGTGASLALTIGGSVTATSFIGSLASATGLPISTGVSGLGSGVATFLATPSSANLATALTGETGSGAAVFGTGPTISAPLVTGDATFGTAAAAANAIDIGETAGQVTYEGATADAFETRVSVTDPTADNLITWPNSSGTASLETGQAVGTGGMVGNSCRVLTTCTYANATGTAPAGTSEEVVRTCTVKGGTLTTDGTSILLVSVGFQHANNTNNVTGRIRFGGIGGTIVAASAVSSTANARFYLAGEIARISSTSQWASGGLNSTSNSNGGAATQTLSGDVDLVATLTNASAASDGTVNYMRVSVCN